MKKRVKAKVVFFEISGNTAKVVFPTRPRVTLFTASWLTARPSLGATGISLAMLHLSVLVAYHGLRLDRQMSTRPIHSGPSTHGRDLGQMGRVCSIIAGLGPNRRMVQTQLQR